MALIHCTECGKQISDKAKTCIHCGCPIDALSSSGMVRIKMSPLQSPTGINGEQKVTVEANGKILWEGKSGDMAEIKLACKTYVIVRYHLCMMHYAGEYMGFIDPEKGRKYNVTARQGFMSTKLSMQMVDVFDAE